jgi:hypothetical protein
MGGRRRATHREADWPARPDCYRWSPNHYNRGRREHHDHRGARIPGEDSNRLADRMPHAGRGSGKLDGSIRRTT